MANYIAMLAGQANKEVTFNDLAFNLSPAAIFGINTNNTAGLSVCLFGGKLTKDIKFDDLIYLTLTANATNYVSANVSTKQVTVNTVKFDGVPLWKFITNANSITNLNTADERAHSLFTHDSSIVLATQTVAGLVKTSPTVFLDLNNQLDVAIDYVTIKKDANGKLYSVGGGSGGGGAGLTYFKEVKYDTAPHNTIPLISFELIDSTISTDIFFGLGGNGSYIFFNSGANKIGRNTVDFTSSRTLATQIVSGNASGGGGQDMTISRNYCFGWGYKNTISGDYSTAFGMDNTVSGSKSFAFGNKNTVSGSNSGVWGDNCKATSDNSLAVGYYCQTNALGAFTVGYRNINNSKYSIMCGEGGNTLGIDGDLTLGGRWNTDVQVAGNAFQGSAQTRIHRYKSRISSASTLSKILIEVSTNSSTPSIVNQFSLVSNQVRSFVGKVLMIQENSTAIAEFEIKGLIKRPSTASTTELLQSTITQTFADTTAVERGFSVSLSVNTTLGCLTITCSTANYSSTIYCYAKIESDDVISAL